MRRDPDLPTSDPLGAYMAGAFLAADRTPIPLVDTRVAVKVEAGLAEVETRRTFRSAEDKSIEVTITFPVPVHAVLFRLSARIGDRRLAARAQRREQARATYEAAVDSGRSAVLHEEVLKGVHTLSLAHVPPGAEIEVETVWALPLSVVDGKGMLRIPLTVGDIYGCSPLSESDDLVSGGVQLTGRLNVESNGQRVWLHGRPLATGEATIPLNRPIDLSVPLWEARPWRATSRDGSTFEVSISAAPATVRTTRLAVLVDHSGSMAALASLVPGRRTKHQAIKQALGAVAKGLSVGDELAIWEFDDVATFVGTVVGAHKGEETDATAIANLADPHGGTEIGSALQAVLGREHEADILLVTDGNSYALDVSELARHQHRISVLLVGEDSLEANVGHLAALTGGDIFVAADHNIEGALKAAFASLRRAPGSAKAGEVHRSGAVITYRRVDEEAIEPGPLNDALVALAVSFEFKDLAEPQAAELAAVHGIVTHLTSLVLVDDAGEIQDGLPAQRKVALPSPATAVLNSVQFSLMEDAGWDDSAPSLASRRAGRRMLVGIRDDARSLSTVESLLRSRLSASVAPSSPPVRRIAATLAGWLDWSVDPNGLVNGDREALRVKPRLDQKRFDSTVDALLKSDDIVDLARELGKSPLQAIVLLMAYTVTDRNRTAARLLRNAVNAAALRKLAQMVVEIDGGPIWTR